MPESLAFASIRELGLLLRSKQVTAVELAELFLGRLKRFGPDYHAVVQTSHFSYDGISRVFLFGSIIGSIIAMTTGKPYHSET